MKRNIKLLAAFNFFTDFRLYSAVLVIYFAKVTGSFTLAMSLFSVTMIVAALFDIPTGVYSDRIGRKNTLMFGAAAASLYSIFYAVGGGYWMLFVGAVLEGLSRAFYSGNNDALLHNSLTNLGEAEQYGHYLGRVSSMFQAALAVAAVLGSIIANWSFTWVMWLSVIPQFVCLCISLFIMEPAHPEKIHTDTKSHISTSLSLLWNNKKLRLLSFAQILGFGVGEAGFNFRPAFIATLWPTWAIGFSQMISYIGGGISYWFSSTLIKKFTALKLLLFESVYNRTVNIFALLFPTVASPAIMSTTSFLYGATEVASNDLMQKEFTQQERATLASITSFGSSILFSIFSIILGKIADMTNPTIALLVTEACSLPRVYILWLLNRVNSYD